MNPALITMIEGKGCDNRGSKLTNRRDLELEAIRCFASWRKKGGELKDIPIYCIAPTKRLPHMDTILALNDLNVNYIEHYIPETEKFSCGYWNVPLGGIYFENSLKEDFLIHIDLDMELLVEPSKDFFKCDPYVLAKIGQWAWSRNINPEFEINFETCLICSWRENGFYQKWYDSLMEEERNFDGSYEYTDMEEHIVDKMYYESGYKIEPIKDFQVGPRCKPIANVKDISRLYFYHGHYHENRILYVGGLLSRLYRKGLL